MVREKDMDLRKPLIRTRGGGVRAGGGSNPSDMPEPATTYTIAVTSSNSNQGTVTGGGTYTEGSTVTLRATPKSGYEFSGWYSGDTKVSESNPYTFTASEDKTIVGRFAAVQVDYDVYYGAVNNPTGDSHAADTDNLASLLTGDTVAQSTKTVNISMTAGKTFIVLYDDSKAVPTGYDIETAVGHDTGTDFDNGRKFYSSEVEINGVTYKSVELKGGNTGTNAMPVAITFTKQ